jgi:hypothetical protein
MEALCSEYTEVWINAACIPLVQFADRVRCVKARGLFLLPFPDLRPLSLEVELRSFDRIYSWYGSLLMESSDELRRINPKTEFFPAQPPECAPVSASEFHCNNVNRCTPCPPATPRIRVKAQEKRRVVIRPFASSCEKTWPLERFADLARCLADRVPVVWLIRPSETLGILAAGEVLEAEDLADVAGAIAGSTCYIGNDTGVSHLAAAVGTPVVALFGPTEPRIWAPRGRASVDIVRSPDRVMANLPMEPVRSTVEAVLNAASAFPTTR